MAWPATRSTIPPTPQFRHDNKDGNKAPPGAGWQAALAVVKCARHAAPAQPWIPMSKINPDPFTTRPEIEGTFGVVTSTHWIATAVGMATLEKGGNAFDAAVATAFTLQVVEPHLNGPGGDVPIIVHDVKRGRTEVICGQGPAPAGAGPWPQITSVRPRLTSWTMIGTSPPGPLRCGSTTCRVNAVATAASKALPPFSRAAMPTAVAIQCVDVTTPKVPSISGRVVKGFGLIFDMTHRVVLGRN